MELLADRIFVETGYAGVNVGAIQTSRGFICIDTPSYPRDARDWALQLGFTDARPVRFVVLTDAHGDRILQTRWVRAPVIAHAECAQRLQGYERRYPQAIVDSLATRDAMAAKDLSAAPIEQVTVSFSESMYLYDGDSPVQLNHVAGSYEGSIMAFLPTERILFTGDLLVAGTPPVLTYGRIDAWLAALEWVAARAAAGITVVPGRGPLATQQDVLLLAEFLRQTQSCIEALAGHGFTRSELNAVINDLLNWFPDGGLPRDWIQAHYKSALEAHLEACRQERQAAESAPA